MHGRQTSTITKSVLSTHRPSRWSFSREIDRTSDK